MYAAFASVYDRLMADVDYPAWARYYHTLLVRHGVAQGCVCECACGTGSLTIPLAKQGYQMTGVDISPDMLFEASQKARKCGAQIPFVEQDMCQLRLHRPVHAVLCTNDGVNYLESTGKLAAFFRAAYDALLSEGMLIFDLSTPYKLEHDLGNRLLGDETEEFAYLWRNRLSSNHRYVELDLTIFIRQADGSYKRINEHQEQYLHTADQIRNQLAAAGFTNIAFYGDQQLSEPALHERRWHIAAHKPAPDHPKELP